MTIYRFDFGKSLQVAQAMRGVNCVDLAKRMGVTKQQVSQWRYRPDGKISLVCRICDQLDMEPYQFLELSDVDKH